MKNVSIHSILLSIIFLHGNSGSGKGDTFKAIEKMSPNVLYLASGEYFRNLGKKADELAKQSINVPSDITDALELMSNGKQVEGLWPIALQVKDVIKEFIISGKDTKLVVDGMLRNGEDISSLQSGVRIPSQILQVAGMIHLAIKELVEEGKITVDGYTDQEIKDSEVQDLKSIIEDGLIITEISRAIKETATHIAISISPEEAKGLMQFRAVKALSDVFFSLGKMEQTEKTRNAMVNILEMMQFMTGNFTGKDGKIVINETNELKLAPRLPDPIHEMDVDEEVIKRALEIINFSKLEYKRPEKDKDVIKVLLGELKTMGIDGSILPRLDDMLSPIRETRTEEYNNNVEGKLFKELFPNGTNGSNFLEIHNTILGEGDVYKRFLQQVEGKVGLLFGKANRKEKI